MCVFLGNSSTLHVAARDLGTEPQKERTQSGSDGIQNSQSLGIVLQTNISVSPKSLVSGGNRQHLMEHCPGSPSPLLQVPGGTKKRTEEKLKEECEREERHGGKGESLDKMNYAKLSEAAIVGGAGCVKGSQPWSPQAPSTTLTAPHGWEPSDLCSGKWPTTRRGRGGVRRDWPVRWVTGELSWRDTPATTSTLFITIIYGGHQRGDLSWYVQPPCGNIITEQRLIVNTCHFSILVSSGLFFSNCFVC